MRRRACANENGSVCRLAGFLQLVAAAQLHASRSRGWGPRSKEVVRRDTYRSHSIVTSRSIRAVHGTQRGSYTAKECGMRKGDGRGQKRLVGRRMRLKVEASEDGREAH